jgi:signal peptidase II
VTKVVVRATLTPGSSIVLLRTPSGAPLFELSYVRNTGAAFGMLPGLRWVFVAISVAVLAGVAWVWFRYKPTFWPVVVALGLVIGGDIGNLVERAAGGRVTDFLYVHYWPVFNLADSAIVVGEIILVAWLLFRHDEDDGDSGGDGDDAPGSPEEPGA